MVRRKLQLDDLTGRILDEQPSSRSLPLGVQETRELDPPLQPPAQLPNRTEKTRQERWEHTATYPSLESNIDAKVMEFSEEPIPEIRSDASVAEYGASTPFRHHTVIQQYLQRLFERNGYEKLIEYHTTVEKAQKQGSEWVLTLRRSEADHDSWWQERFDALVVCSGHYNVPNLPDIPGLVELEQQHPGTVEHAKNFRNKEDYRDLVRGKIGGPCSPCRTWLSWAHPFLAWMRRSTSSVMPRRP